MMRCEKGHQHETTCVICTLALHPCRRHPPAVRSQQELQQWTCHVHNVVNQSLGKPAFNCDVVGARWSPLECGGDEDSTEAVVSACDMTSGRSATGARGRAGHM
jgi:hypothetical protein